MSEPPLILIFLLLLSGALCVYMAAWAQLRRRQPGAVEFSLLTWAGAVYSLGYAVEITRTQLADLLWALRIEYLGLAFLPALLLIFSLRMVRDRPLDRRLTGALLVVPLVTLLMVWTADRHSLYYVSPRVETGWYFPVFSAGHGLWYNLQLTYVILSGIVSPLILLWNARRFEQRRRWQASLAGVGALFPIGAAVLNALGVSIYGIDLGPFGISLSALFFGWALFRYRLFEIVPAAREVALDAVRDAFVVVDHSGRIVDFNQAARNLPGAADWKIGQPFPRSGSLGEFVHHNLRQPGGMLEFSIRDQDGAIRYFWVHAYPLKDTFNRMSGSTFLISDVSETVRLIHRLDEQASKDELTGLLNRRALIEAAQRLFDQISERGGSLGVVLMDLDNFKTINDTYGHQVGDRLLRWVGECLSKTLRHEDLVGRYGGDEFVIFLPDASTATAVQIAERLRAAITLWQPADDPLRVPVSASFGVFATVLDDNLTMEDLIRAADQALYRAKRDGRNRCAF